MVRTVKLSISIDTVELEPNDNLTIQIGGPDSWTSILVYGNGIVELREQGKVLSTVNMPALVKYLGEHK